VDANQVPVTAGDPYDVVVVGSGYGGQCARSELLKAGIDDIVILGGAEVVGAAFDEVTDTWTVRTRSDGACRGRVMIADDSNQVVGAGGLTIEAARRDGLHAYLGVAMRGFPNYFMITDRPRRIIEEQVRYILECLTLMEPGRRGRIEVRRSTQELYDKHGHAAELGSKVSHWRRIRRAASSAFDVSSAFGVEDEVYDGPATLTHADDRHDVRVRLAGHLDPIDGRYHWQGMILDAPAEAGLTASAAVTLAVGDRIAQARITDQTPWGSYSVAGVGAPPFALDEVELAVPLI
jgi:cation diffusion facilitator CzcD-associated flavoprotein CzcO